MYTYSQTYALPRPCTYMFPLRRAFVYTYTHVRVLTHVTEYIHICRAYLSAAVDRYIYPYIHRRCGANTCHGIYMHKSCATERCRGPIYVIYIFPGGVVCSKRGALDAATSAARQRGWRAQTATNRPSSPNSKRRLLPMFVLCVRESWCVSVRVQPTLGTY